MNTQPKQTLLEDRNWAPEQLGRVLVLGLGKSGKAAASYCLNLLGTRVDELCIAAGQENEDARTFAECAATQGAQVAFDSFDIQEVFGGVFDVCIASPGIPQTSDFYQSALQSCTEVISEVEFAWRECDTHAKWIAITGTNGKTTTTALCTHLLRTAGINALSVGNIGDTCLEAVSHNAAEVYVAEVSSFQLASTARFAPDVAVVMNITPDHLSWHGGMDAYIEAKYAVLEHLDARAGAWAVLDATNEIVRAKVRELKKQGSDRGFNYIAMGTKDGVQGDMRAACAAPCAAFLDADKNLVVAFDGQEYSLCAADELLSPGAHNVGNALLASAAALCLGVRPSSVASALRSFASLEHRIEACGTVDGITCYNDSKATNVDATLKALAAFDPARPIVLLGGRDKNTDLSLLVEEASAHCKEVVLYGESRERFADAFKDAAIPVHMGEHMADSFEKALGIAQEGDIILLSPACASFDEFDSFEQRGRVFKDLVRKHSKHG